MYDDDEREEKPRRPKRERLPSCEFCGTDDKAHNVTRKLNENMLMLCDNPVCNLVPKSGK